MGKRVGLALVAAALGWFVCSCLLTAFEAVAGYRAARAYGYLNRWNLWEGISLFFLACTGVFTLLVTLCFILPYVAARSSESILAKPGRMYVEPAVIGVTCITLFDLASHPSAYTVWRYFPMQIGYMLIALLTSVLSSWFFLYMLRRAR